MRADYSFWPKAARTLASVFTSPVSASVSTKAILIPCSSYRGLLAMNAGWACHIFIFVYIIGMSFVETCLYKRKESNYYTKLILIGCFPHAKYSAKDFNLLSPEKAPCGHVPAARCLVFTSLLSKYRLRRHLLCRLSSLTCLSSKNVP